jgi:protein-S-isoprenylcysteine O-methyltransferase Ste14
VSPPAYIGAVLILMGLALHARAHSRLNGVVPFEMVCHPMLYLTDGVFRLRHPAYIGNLLEISGIGAIFLGWGGFALFFAALPFYADRIFREEGLRHAASRTDARRQAA